MLKLGDQNIKLFVGSTPVKTAWLGTTKLYPEASLSVPERLEFAAAGSAVVLSVETQEGREWSLSELPAWCTASALSGSGPAEVTVTAANNTSEEARGGEIVVTAGDFSASCSLFQSAGVRIYTDPVIADFHFEGDAVHVAPESIVPACGGIAVPAIRYRQDYTWNGVTGSGGRVESGGTIVYSGNGVATDGTVSVPSKGTTFSAVSPYSDVTVTLVLNGKSHTITHRLCQAANYVTGARALKTRTLSYPVIAAGGGTSVPQWDSYPTDSAVDTLWGFIWASGESGSWSQARLGGSNAQTGMTYRWAGAAGNFTALSADGVVTASSRGTAVGNLNAGPTVTGVQTCTFTNDADYGGNSVTWDTTATGTPTQEANHITGIQLTPGSLSYASVAYTGGRSNPITTYQPGWHFQFSSGVTTEETAVPAGYGSKAIHNTWSGSASGATVGATWGEVVWSANNSTSSRSITITRKAYVVLTPNTTNYPGAPTVTSNTQTYVGTCTQAAMPQTYGFRYSYSNQASKYPRFAVTGYPGSELLGRAIGGLGTPIHMLSYRDAVTHVQGTTTSYVSGEPEMMVLDSGNAYIGSGYITGWSDSSYALGFIMGQQGNFMNNYPYKYLTQSFSVKGSGFTLSGIALFEKNYGDYEVAGYSWYIEANTSGLLSLNEARAVQRLAETGVVTEEDVPGMTLEEFEALALKINAARRPDTDSYIRNDDGTWTVVPNGRAAGNKPEKD